jgi:hypothetical protein
MSGRKRIYKTEAQRRNAHNIAQVKWLEKKRLGIKSRPYKKRQSDEKAEKIKIQKLSYESMKDLQELIAQGAI